MAVATMVWAVVLGSTGTRAQQPRERHYYLAAEEMVWNFAPTGKEQLMHGGAIPEPWRGSLAWPKTRFIEYTDGAFTVKKPQPSWLGVLGPVLRGEVGDTIKVHFLNRS
jgi:hypothetical protein